MVESSRGRAVTWSSRQRPLDELGHFTLSTTLTHCKAEPTSEKAAIQDPLSTERIQDGESKLTAPQAGAPLGTFPVFFLLGQD